MNYRKLTEQEINSLKNQDCSCDNWEDVFVKNGFSTNRIRRVNFAGTVKLGIFSKSIKSESGIIKACGLYNSTIQDCEISDNVFIANVKNLINYKIGNAVVVENVFHLMVCGETAFGNGAEIEILNEGGGRELPIYDKLSSQIAYLLVVYRHNSRFIDKMQKIIRTCAESKRATKGLIQQGVTIENCQKIVNVSIGEKACISGALLLQEGTIISHAKDPVFIGPGVTAKSFIIQSGSKIDGSVHLQNCFVGQGVQLGKQFSAENSAFFANSEGFHGEACSVFAGPYTVTHHKSTLLIAGLFSFYNAGSGSNQSNHMYKIGPVHQGILERGAKTGSFSYLLWPSRVGAFSVVIGKHYTNFDASNLPFSYILESNGTSLLMPAMNLFTVGTRRDSEKWPNRDRRKDSEKHDLLNFGLFNPYTVGKIKKGIAVLRALAKQKDQNGLIEYQGIKIKRTKINIAIEFYSLAINIFIGNELLKRVDRITEKTAFSEFIGGTSDTLGKGDWVDLCGMFTPKIALESLIQAISKGNINTIDKIEAELKSIHDNYDSLSWNWCQTLIEEKLNKKIESLAFEDLVQLISDWKSSYIKYDELVLQDAEKEFSARSQIGYGMDGDETVRTTDFEAVRGSYNKNKFVVQIKEESKSVIKKAEHFIRIVQTMSQD